MKCNLCELEIAGHVKSPILFNHMKENHKDIHDLHKDNPEATVGFRVEFLHLNVLKDCGEGSDVKSQPVFLSEACEPAVVTEVQAEVGQMQEDDVINMQYVMLDTKRKYTKKAISTGTGEQRKRSWIWKYFDKLSNIIYRCNICNVVLSIKGCNTNNLNRHMRSRHPESYRTEKMMEMSAKQKHEQVTEESSEDAEIDECPEIDPYKGDSRWFCRDDHYYVVYRTNGRSLYMRCASWNCPVRWIRKFGKAGPITGEHNHSPTPWVPNRNTLFQTLKRRAATETGSVTAIYKEEAARYPDAAPHLAMESVLPSMRKWRFRAQKGKYM